jgi:DNA-binding CsgD family transcriptional regulator
MDIEDKTSEELRSLLAKERLLRLRQEKANRELQWRLDELERDNRQLEEANATLKRLLEKRHQGQPQADAAHSNPDGAISSPLRNADAALIQLTPSEIRVTDFIKKGKSNKEIADLMHISVRTVEFHRNNIRKKMGLHRKKTNLQSFLMTLS